MKVNLLVHLHLQVCDVIHDSPALDTMALSVDEVVVDLRFRDSVTPLQHNSETRRGRQFVGLLTLWNTKDVDFVKASAAMSQWILNTLYLQKKKKRARTELLNEVRATAGILSCIA